MFGEGSPEEACLSNPGREKERRHSRWENNPNSEAGKWHTGLEQGGEVNILEKRAERKGSESVYAGTQKSWLES